MRPSPSNKRKRELGAISGPSVAGCLLSLPPELLCAVFSRLPLLSIQAVRLVHARLTGVIDGSAARLGVAFCVRAMPDLDRGLWSYRSIAGSRPGDGLHRVDLSDLRLDGNVSRRLGEMLSTNTTITSVDLSRNFLDGDDVMRIIACLHQNTTLLHLDLSCNRLKYADVQRISSASKPGVELVFYSAAGKRRHDEWPGDYVPAPPVPPLPQPASLDLTSDVSTLLGEKVLFVRWTQGETFSVSLVIPFGGWQCTGWYKERIADLLGVATHEQRLWFAGAIQSDHLRYSGMAVMCVATICVIWTRSVVF
eukprot:TRINITY_DN4502_c0_g1_i2.p1 TRINITY_DN4502_c0_g1~~TRINITY_DN4502_c0_g1_i2.p1  ORF type:complete len:308 (+),score=73.24 TRINITY_DN4502_c0_g1_i2:98-1021(+)